jgi:hypothetical protein
MRRRDLLGAAGAGALAGLAGCLDALGGAGGEPTPLADRPDAVYLPTHFEGMEMVGMEKSGPYACALTYTFPHRFWLVTGTRTKAVDVAAEDSVHLMPVVFERETGIVPPDVNPQLRVTRDGEQVAQLAPWPMLSQPMGFHFGDNVALGGEGTVTAAVSIGAPTARRTGALADNQGNVSFEFEFEFEEATLRDLPVTDVPADDRGTRAAVEPMDMEMLPGTSLPAPEGLPGDLRGTATSGDGVFAVTVLDDAMPFGGGEDEAYLAVSARTPYNRNPLALMALSASLDGTALGDGLRESIDPELGYHYGAVVDEVADGADLTLTVDAPPQVARHEGYETAFVEMPPMELTL